MRSTMARWLANFFIPFIVAGAALLLGLAGSTLRTGRIDPLDWLGGAALALVLLIAIARQRIALAGVVALWALVTLPIAVLIVFAAVSVPWRGLGLLAFLLCVVGLLAWRLDRRWALLIGLVASASAAPFLLSRDLPPTDVRPLVGVMTALPLQGPALGAVEGIAPVESLGLSSPLWRGLEARLRLQPLDVLNRPSLDGLDTLLLAQPRALAPAELVALDQWIRAGGRAIILADPLLHWPDPRPIAHPARAPLTSLLDPLLAHWGLRLEPAERMAVERRLLGGGALLQLAGASRFTLTGERGCGMEDQGLVARCRISEGHVLLVADADWINDALWTLAPERPLVRASHSADALPLLSGWLRGEPVAVDPLSAWLQDGDSLMRALRYALVALLLGAAIPMLVAGAPHLSHLRDDTKMDQKWNKDDTVRYMG